MYKIEKKQNQYFESYCLKNIISEESVSVIPTNGAVVNRLVLRKENSLYTIIDADDSIIFEENKRYSSCILIPFANRIKDGQYQFESKEYQLDTNNREENSAIHGLVYNKPFEVAELVEEVEFALIKLHYHFNNGTAGYPFRFKVEIVMKIDDSGFENQISIINQDITNMPMSAGWHPYFTLNEKVDDLYMRLPESNRIVVDEKMIPTGDVAANTKYNEFDLINNDLIDNGYEIISKSPVAITSLYSKTKDLAINFWQENGNKKYNYLQLYIPPERRSIAIEPMTSGSNAFNNKNGLIILAPEERLNLKCGVYLSNSVV